MTANSLEQWLTGRVAAITGLPVAGVDRKATFNSLGLDSVLRVSLALEIEKHVEHPVDAELLQTYSTIASLIEVIACTTH